MDNFLGKSKLNFWPKNEDFEQCVVARTFAWEEGIITGVTFSLFSNTEAIVLLFKQGQDHDTGAVGFF